MLNAKNKQQKQYVEIYFLDIKMFLQYILISIVLRKGKRLVSTSKRDILVRKTKEVLYRDGFHATGMDKLVKETGVSKMTIYKHFRTKEDLILAALRLRDEEFRSSFFRKIEAAASTPKGRLLAIFDAIAEWIASRDFHSCMFIKAASEYQDPNHPINITATEHKDLILDFIRDLAEKAAARDPDVLARQLFMLVEGETVTAFMMRKGGIARDAKKAAEILINQQIPV